MRTKAESRIGKVIDLAEDLPYFSFDDLAPVEKDRKHLKTLFYRYVKSGELFRLKKGFYVTKGNIERIRNRGALPWYTEFLANRLHEPSYLSLETILFFHRLLTEIPVKFTSITTKKPTRFSNKFGGFLYHKIKPSLFCGFEAIKHDIFTIIRATKAKALFDFLYLRKNSLPSKDAINALRLNLDSFNVKDKKEFKKYIGLEGSKKMKEIFNGLFK